MQILLACGKIALVDEVDFSYLCGFNWHFHVKGYASRSEDGSCCYMHLEIAKRMKLIGAEVDHRNQNKLDNRRSNLRAATKSQNRHNTGICKSNTSGYKGVDWDKKKQMWRSRITINCKERHIGYFVCPKQAAVAYNLVAQKELGEFAHLNEVK